MKPRARRIIEKALAPLAEFLRLEAAGGLLLMAATAAALLVANSPLASLHESWLGMPLGIRAGAFQVEKPLLLWVNDGLMAIFFLLVGLELKREVLEGHLTSIRSASLAAFGAAGGMLAPAAIYLAFNRGDPVALQGWAIPVATDIAFALGVLSLLGNRVPVALKVFLLSLAIFDDLGAIIIIALFYTSQLSITAIIVAAILVVGLACLNRCHVMRPAAYFVLGVPLWFAVLKSGVHATLAGVVLAVFIPLRRSEDHAPRAAVSPLHDLEHALHPWVAFGILPVFAFANAGVPLLGLAPASLLDPVPLGVALGLLAGKPIGVMALCWLGIRLRAASLPADVRWRHLLGVALLSGIGFTMSLFLASLAFEQGGPANAGNERLGILVGSLLAGIAGYTALRFLLPRPPKPSEA